MGARPFDMAIRKVAGSQYGAFSARQARHVGGTHEMLRHRVSCGHLDVVADGVYVFAAAPRCWRQKLWIGLLEVGDHAVVDGRAAYPLWGLPGFREGPVELLAPHGHKNHRLTVGVLHETRLLPAHHVRRVDGIPVTSPERQVDLGGEGWIGRVDCYFRHRLIVELDGRIGHVSELDQRRDKERDAELTAAGFVVIHFTWEQIVSRPAWVIGILLGALAAVAA